MPLPYWLLWDLYTYLIGLGLPAATAREILYALAQLRIF